jgi:acetoin utilization deacetylase AcuC-like enzyme
MGILYTLVPSPEHTFAGHPENPERFSLFARWETELANHLIQLPAAPAQVEDLLRVHSANLVEYLPWACQQAPAIIDHAPTYVAAGSWTAALNAAGGTLAVSRAVLQGENRRGFALVRPPGHHAEPGQSMGFCLLNNIAIAVADALQQGLPRAAIIDFDAHHGNGTQAIFKGEERVGYFSSHKEGIYPLSGGMDDEPHARGRLINLPLPDWAGDQVFDQIVDDILQPWLKQFQPEMLFISAGFDAHWADFPIRMGISTSGYFHLAQRLAALADEFCEGRVAFVLEGGYEPPLLADNILAVLRALAGEPDTPDPIGPCPHPEPDIRGRIAYLRRLHRF